MIPVKNIYHMLAYAFQILNENGYREMATEQFDNTEDLLSAILVKGVSNQLKKGIKRDYISETDVISGVRGRINMTESIKTQALIRNQLVCTYDEFSMNTYLNQIIKTTMIQLLHADINAQRKKELKQLLPFFAEVQTIDVNGINWKVNYNRNDQTYRLIISVCSLIIHGLLQTQEKGRIKTMDFIDEQRMCRLYEKFILEYYRKKHKELTANASRIPWALDDGIDDMLPVMQSDIMLTSCNDCLIIDAKYYGSNTQERFDRRTVISGNIYQIFTYVKNKESQLKASGGGRVGGMLLYAGTDEEIQPDQTYHMDGNEIKVRTLDLNQNFQDIENDLDAIADMFFK